VRDAVGLDLLVRHGTHGRHGLGHRGEQRLGDQQIERPATLVRDRGGEPGALVAALAVDVGDGDDRLADAGRRLVRLQIPGRGERDAGRGDQQRRDGRGQ